LKKTRLIHDQTSEITIIAKGAGIVFLGTIIGTGLKFFFELIVARKIGAELFGVFFLGISAFKIGDVLASCGMQNGVLRYVALFNGEKDVERTKGTIILALKSVALASLPISITLIIFSRLISTNIFHKFELTNVLRLFSIAIPFSAFTTILIFSLQGFKKVQYRIYITELFQPSLRIILLMFAVLFGLQLLSITSIYIIPIVLSISLSFYWLKKMFPQILDKRINSIYETHKIISFSWPLFFVDSLKLILAWIPTLILGYFKTLTDVGLFSAAYRTVLVGQLVVYSFNSIFAPIISDLYNRKMIRALENLFKIVAKWIFSLSLPVFIFMIFYSKEILNVFGEEFTAGNVCLIILAISYLINAGVGPSAYLIMMAGQSKISFANTIFIFTMNITLSLFLIPKYGIIGAAFATGISTCTLNIIRLIEVYLILKIHPYKLGFLKPLLAGGTSLLLLFLIMKYLIQTTIPLISLSVSLLFFFLVYAFIFSIYCAENEEKVILQKIIQKFRLKS